MGLDRTVCGSPRGLHDQVLIQKVLRWIVFPLFFLNSSVTGGFRVNEARIPLRRRSFLERASELRARGRRSRSLYTWFIIMLKMVSRSFQESLLSLPS